jgi:hypothetical protein
MMRLCPQCSGKRSPIQLCRICKKRNQRNLVKRRLENMRILVTKQLVEEQEQARALAATLAPLEDEFHGGTVRNDTMLAHDQEPIDYMLTLV